MAGGEDPSALPPPVLPYEPGAITIEPGIIAPARVPRILTLAFITYSLAFLDRVNYGFGTAGGMNADLHLTPKVSSLLAATFFIGYLLFQIPGAAYAARSSVKWLMFWSLLLWGLCSSATGLVHSVWSLAVVRFTLGAVEGVVFPALLIFLTHWFTKRERSRANTLLILGNPVTLLWSSIVSGLLTRHFGWRWMFVLEGLPSVLWAFLWLWLADDRPRDAKWLTTSEQAGVQEALDSEQRHLTPVPNYLAACLDPAVLVFCVIFFLWSCGFYGFSMWLPKMINEGTSSHRLDITGWLTAIPYCLAIVAMLGVSWASDKTLRRKIFVWPIHLIGAASFAAAAMLGVRHFPLAMIFVCIGGACNYAPYGPFWAMLPEMLPREVVAAAMALINSFGALGGFVGTYVVGYLNERTHNSASSFGAIALAFACTGLLTMVTRTKTR